MPAIKWSTVERQLTDMDKPELIELLRDLFKSSDMARTCGRNSMRVMCGYTG
jgi:hypothetical protein